MLKIVKLNPNKLNYMNTDGSMVRNAWINQDGRKHFVGADGKEKRGWVFISGKYYLLTEEGIVGQSGWLKQDGKWYFINQDGRKDHTSGQI